jgi:hypothetical protein
VFCHAYGGTLLLLPGALMCQLPSPRHLSVQQCCMLQCNECDKEGRKIIEIKKRYESPRSEREKRREAGYDVVWLDVACNSVPVWRRRQLVSVQPLTGSPVVISSTVPQCSLGGSSVSG